ncbi:MAG: RraA family protein [Sedimentisphaerales bacterium]|nr:RraA family protein [Sedimentisphaerales bacterium]
MKSREVRTAIVGVIMFLFVFSAYALIAQEAADKADPKIEQMRAGKNFIPTKVYSAEEDQEILKLFEGLRVADVVDGMDKVGLRNVGAMDPAIHPAWTDTKTFKHRFIGIALTVRNAPVNWPLPPKMNTKEFDEYQAKHYTTTAAEPFVDLIRPGTAVIIDDSLGYDVGPVGSFNIMIYKSKGCVGVVTDATARDLDEVAAQNIPLYIKEPGRRIRPGRNQTESVNMPVVCGGVLVMPGDVILADGDGVLCVPRAYAKEVADYARATLQMDMPRRKEMYQKLGIPLDDSVK